MQLLQVLGKAQKEMGLFRCRKAIEVLNSLPPQHFETGWVLSTIGKAHFELSEYGQVFLKILFLIHNFSQCSFVLRL